MADRMLVTSDMPPSIPPPGSSRDRKWRRAFFTPFRSSAGQLPRLAVLVVEQLVGGVVVCEPLGLRVPLQVALRLVRDVADERGRRRAVPELDVATRLLAALHAVEEVAGVVGVENPPGHLLRLD